MNFHAFMNEHDIQEKLNIAKIYVLGVKKNMFFHLE